MGKKFRKNGCHVTKNGPQRVTLIPKIAEKGLLGLVFQLNYHRKFIIALFVRKSLKMGKRSNKNPKKWVSRDPKWAPGGDLEPQNCPKWLLGPVLQLGYPREA